MQKRKIVGIVHVPYRIRGGEDVHVEHLQRTYKSLGYEIVDFVRLLPPQSELRSAASSLGLGDFSRWDQILESQGINFLHLHNIHPLLGPAFLRWISQRKVPTLATIHNHRFYCTNGLALLRGNICKDCRSSVSLSRPVIRNCNDSIAKSAYHSIALLETRRGHLLEKAATCLLALSPYIARELELSGISPGKIQILPLGVDVSGAAASPAQGSDVIFAARLSEEKGLRCFLKTVPLLPKVSFLIAGEGPLETEARAAASKYPNLKFVGKLSRAHFLAELKASRVACVPSICHEGYSLLAAEALSLGLQVVVTDSESLLHFREKPFDAIPAKVGEPSSLAASLLEALERPCRPQEHAASLRELLSLDKFKERLSLILKDLGL